MVTPTDLFESDDSSTVANASTRWLLVTNQRNLLYMLAAGLVMPPKGFGQKYYQDTLCSFPGWIPLFADSVPEASIEQSVSERSHLIPCLVEIDLSSLRGRVMAIGEDGLLKEVNFPEGIEGSERILLIPAPLPITWFNSIIFQSGDDKSSCDADARDFGNVPLTTFKRKVVARLFSGTSDVAWPPVNLELPNRDMPMDGPLAAGGMMAMLLHLANLGDIGVASCRLAFDAEDSVAETISEPMLSVLGTWEHIGHAPDTNNVLQNLFWGAIDKLVAWRLSETSESTLDVLLGHLESTADQLDERMKQALSKLAGDLKTVAGFADSTITELFERHPKSFSRVMTLFFLRENCSELLEFRHPLLNEIDYLTAAILFSARDGWLGLPLELRDFPGLQEAVPHRMAAMAHRITDTGIDLGVPPKRPKPLRELFAPGQRGWSKIQREAALILARDRKWSGIQTRITLGKGDYRLEVDGRGMHVLIEGEAKAVVTEVDSDQFFVELARERLTSKQERKVIGLLKM
ncbi:hypothetical protein [endosymbiont of Lamellibrachia barhami]|uniref:hypothetical protein n=1 Tax=endosymbiont of Lamellibrachia barhami TaxID=205975 RepID=UPI0015A7DB39|nr:hypothetical protein [endosymbiont of Lamellibrachia barhami]